MSLTSDVPPAQVTSISSNSQRLIIVTVLGGAAAGSCVDLALYPLDTLKTRLQSQYGFIKSGGFRGIYKGIGPTSIGSPVTAGIFFGVYNFLKHNLTVRASEAWSPCIHMFSATLAEIVCCTTKVPMEIVKQRRQASFKNLSAIQILVSAVHQEGFRGLYRGFGSTIIRDVPFSLVEFPIWEWLKKKWSSKVDRELNSVEVATCGAVAGGVAAAVTTPLDVVKTQIMLTESGPGNTAAPGLVAMMGHIHRKHGIKKLFAGFFPRISMIMLGGAIFFGTYDKCCKLIGDNFL